MTDQALPGRRQIDWFYAPWLVGGHLLALLAFIPWFFSWTGVILCVIGLYVFGGLGISLCYHRLLTHRSFECPKWLEYTLVVLSICCIQDTPARWVAVHRRHHEFADEPPDPHSPIVSFLWSHIGWLLVKNPELQRLRIYERYAKDLLRDRFYRRLEWQPFSFAIIMASWALYFLAGFLVELALGGAAGQAVQFGSSLLVWGVFVRTVVVWHQTWAVNSVTHLWGYRNYETGEDSRNNVLVGLFSNGEGWHNNHHADARSARHGHLRWEIDTTYWVLLLLERLGLAYNLRHPNVRPGDNLGSQVKAAS